MKYKNKVFFKKRSSSKLALKQVTFEKKEGRFRKIVGTKKKEKKMNQSLK